MRKTFAGLLVLLLSVGVLSQESTVKGNLGGVVADVTGAVVPKAKVTLAGPTGNRATTTDSQGRFMFDLLAPGFYSVTAEQTGFKALEMKQVEVFTNRTSTVSIALQPGAVTETVEVSATSVGVDEASSRLDTNLNDTFYSQLPVARNVTGLFYAAAGVNEGGGTGSANPSIAGGSGLENQYVADGVSITDGAFGGIGVFSRNYGALATGINLSFVKEVDVKTGGYEPQYGKSTGGVVQIITKSGSDHFHGGVSAFFGPQRFEVQHLNPDASGRLNQQGVALHQGEWDIAGELGGMGLTRKAVEQGRQAMESIRKLKDRNFPLDVVIVGAGPAGLAATLGAMEHKLRSVTVEQEDSLGGAVYHYPRNKIVMTAPMQLPIIGKVKISAISKEALLEFWQCAALKTGLKINFSERMETITKKGNGFIVKTSRNTYDTRAVLLAIGRRGTPRKLDVPGEELPKVVYNLIDSEQYRHQHVLVVGGGDSALEAALAIADEPGTSVTLSYRGEAFGRVKEKNRQRLQDAEKKGRVKVLLQSNVKKIEPDKVILDHAGKMMEIINNAVIVSVGGVLPTPFLKEIGIMVETKYGTA